MNTTRAARLVAGALSVAAAVAMAATTLTSASAALKGKVTYSKPITVPAPPRSLASAAGNGDGFDLSFDGGQIYNVFHHGANLRVDCHVQATGAQCDGFTTPVTVQGPGPVDFYTSAGSSTAINPTTHHLFVYVNTKDALTVGGTTYAKDTAGVVEVDLSPTTTNRFVRFIRTTPDGEGPPFDNAFTNPTTNVTSHFYYGSAGEARLVGTRFYAMNVQTTTRATTDARNKLMCVDISTQQACAGQPYTVGANTAAVTASSMAVQLQAVGTRVFFPIIAAAAAGGEYSTGTGCFDTTTSAVCGGAWPLSAAGAILPLLDSTGAPTGICVLQLRATTCSNNDGSAASAPTNLGPVMSGFQSYSRWAITLGTRVFAPGTSSGEQLLCFDFATNAACPNFPATYAKSVQLVYTVQSDPANPTCLWINADSPGGSLVNGVYTPDPNGARIQTVDAYSGGACGASGSRVMLSSFVEGTAGCEPTKWGILKVTSTTALTTATAKIQDSSGKDLATGLAMTVASDKLSATLDLNAVTPALALTAPYPSVLLDLQDANGTLTAPISSEMSWEGTYDASCLAGGQTATNGVDTLTGSTTTTVFGAVDTTAPSTTVAPTTTAAGATTTTVGATTTTTAGPATTIVYVQYTGNTVVVTPFTAPTTAAPTTLAPTTTVAPVTTSATTVPVSVLGAVVTAAPTSIAPAMPVSNTPAYTGSNDLDLTMFALALLAVAALVLGGERLSRNRLQGDD